MKTSKYQSLVNLLNEKQTVTHLRGKVRSSVEDFLYNEKTTTGFSAKGKKDIWTNSVSSVLTKLGIQHECGNDAPRGGACGEYVKITSPAVVKAIKVAKAERDARLKAEREEYERLQAEKMAAREASRKAYIEGMVKKFGEDWQTVTHKMAEDLVHSAEAQKVIAEYIESHEGCIGQQVWLKDYKQLKGVNRQELSIMLGEKFNVGYSYTLISKALKSLIF